MSEKPSGLNVIRDEVEVRVEAVDLQRHVDVVTRRAVASL